MTRGRTYHRPSFCQLGFFLLVSSTISRARDNDQISGLISQLANDKTAWSASVGLQKLGNPAIQSLIANLKKDPRVGERDYSRTLIALEKMGLRAIPIVTATFLAEPHQPGESRQQYQDWVRFKLALIEVLAALGPDAIPDLVRIAEAGPALYRDRALRAILGPALTLLLGLGPSFDQWQQIGPTMFEIRQRKKVVQPFLSRIYSLMQEDRKRWKPQAGTPECPAAFILALWGSGEPKQAGIRTLRQLAKTNEPFYFHDVPIRMLAFLGDKSAPELLKPNLPPSGYELRDQYLILTARWLFRLSDPAYFEIILPAFRSQDLHARQEAVRFAEESHDLRFVPVLIPELGDSTPTGARTYGEGAHEEVMGDRALGALRHLTFESVPMDAKTWENWWNHNQTKTWRQLLTVYLNRCMAGFDRTPYWELNSWVTQLQGAYNPAVLPLLGRYVRHPQLAIHATGPDQMSSEGSGYSNKFFPWGTAPTVVTLLLGIAEQGNRQANRLLHVCLASHDPDVRIYGALALTGLGRKTPMNALALEATREEYSKTAVEALLKLGDSRGIGILIQRLARYQSQELESMRMRDYELLLKYTQEDIGYNPQGSPEQQNEGLKEWRKWWKQKRANFTPRFEAGAIDDRFYFTPAHASVSVTR